MRIFRAISDWVNFHYETITVFGAAIFMCLEVRTLFEWVLFLLLAGIIGTIMKLRVYLAEKEHREILRDNSKTQRDKFEQFLEKEKDSMSK